MTNITNQSFTKPGNRVKNDNVGSGSIGFLYKSSKSFVSLISKSDNFIYIALLLLAFEFILNKLIIDNVSYTEIDWSTYMQQIELFVNGERDYGKLEGSTGPVVYPAGFIYVYSILYQLTNQGKDILRAQYIFAGLYILVTAIVFAIYKRSVYESQAHPALFKQIPSFLIVFLCVSKRIHSIFALRLFNDTISMLLFYVSLYLFIRHRWSFGCLFFSLAVSVKMNLLLFAPSLLLLLLMTFGILRTIPKLMICAAVQVLVAVPFLQENVANYLIRSFEFSRQFMYKWTVNWRFVPEDIFLSKPWALGLLSLHLAFLCLFIFTKWCKKDGGIVKCIQRGNANKNPALLSTNFILTVMFTGNLIGITFSRSLHYQFYLWYFHSLPYLLWISNLPNPIKLIVFVMTEFSWNVYPSSNFSSFILFFFNLLLIVSLYKSNVPSSTTKIVSNKKSA
ncbi:hypothetical protein CYY_001248 [Polysphondylium violaceum]|uniref:dolichyl-P-Man:Man5GlcNAc2-PP-dolichol alpha-1,3-mannosyltransferase n=1 Tax=Polysphondylium violaceum TaxID=133409 RepID=A0A8J4V1T6_9MYCE|nr:hypothetical protein CYY_001248 [Polysphondylium violaceum]